MLKRLTVLSLLAAAFPAYAELGATISVRVPPRAVDRPIIIATFPVDGSTVSTATPTIQFIFNMDMDTSRVDVNRVGLPAGMTPSSLVWLDPRTLEIRYVGSLANFGAKRVDLHDGYFVNVSGVPVAAGAGLAFNYGDPNRPPYIVQGPTANPAAVAANQPVTLDVLPFDPDGDTLSIVWDYGDGSGNTGQGASVTYAYTAIGPYLATVTVTDGRGGSAVASVLVGAAAAAPWSVTKAQVGLNFKMPGRDKIMVSGVVDMVAGFDPNGKRVVVDFGGVTQTFTMNAKGQAKVVKDRFSLKRKLVKKQFLGGPVKIQFSLKGSFVSAFIDEGLINETTPKTGKTVTVKALMSIDSRPYEAFVPMLWQAKAERSGKAKQNTAIKTGLIH
jgi:hypothetical protein